MPQFGQRFSPSVEAANGLSRGRLARRVAARRRIARASRGCRSRPRATMSRSLVSSDPCARSSTGWCRAPDATDPPPMRSLRGARATARQSRSAQRAPSAAPLLRWPAVTAHEPQPAADLPPDRGAARCCATRSGCSPTSGSRRGPPRSTGPAEFPWDVKELLAAHDILGLPFPAEYGGLGGELLTVCLADRADQPRLRHDAA